MVAIKVISKLDYRESELVNLRREIDIMCHLDHDNIVRLFEVIETEDEVAMVTEYAHGELGQILEDDKKLGEVEVRAKPLELPLTHHLVHLQSAKKEV